MEDSVFWIWMQQALGIGSIKADWAIRELGSPEKLYKMSEKELRDTGRFAPKEIERIRKSSLEQARWHQKKAKKLGCEIVTPDHPAYPQNLTHIDCMPCVLYVLGELEGLNDELVLTMVGTRDSDEYGIRAAHRLAYDLAAVGCTVASGLAVGIDDAAHEGALQAGGRSIGLLACGMNVDYPQASRRLKRRILDQGGVLLTEFPFGETAHAFHFNIRNRLLAGISSGVIVVQAPKRSGALNTARHALAQNREVFAVPGGIFDPRMKGCNRLIADGGKMVLDVRSILEEYQGRFPAKIDPDTISERLKRSAERFEEPELVALPSSKLPVRSPEKVAVPEQKPERAQPADAQVLEELQISEEARQVYRMLNRQPVTCDLLSCATGFSVMQLMAALTELELADLAEQLPGKRYIRRAL